MDLHLALTIDGTGITVASTDKYGFCHRLPSNIHIAMELSFLKVTGGQYAIFCAGITAGLAIILGGVAGGYLMFTKRMKRNYPLNTGK